jgi:hypothetical protein
VDEEQGEYLMEVIGSVVLHESSRFKYALGNDLTYVDDFGNKVTVPKGFVTDLVSSPRLLWGLVPPHDSKLTKAAILHDYCYTNKVMSKAWADGKFKELLISEGYEGWRAHLLYLSVVLFGRWR